MCEGRVQYATPSANEGWSKVSHEAVFNNGEEGRLDIIYPVLAGRVMLPGLVGAARQSSQHCLFLDLDDGFRLHRYALL